MAIGATTIAMTNQWRSSRFSMAHRSLLSVVNGIEDKGSDIRLEIFEANPSFASGLAESGPAALPVNIYSLS